MIARAFTNVYKYFSPSQCVKPAPALSDGAVIVKF